MADKNPEKIASTVFGEGAQLYRQLLEDLPVSFYTCDMHGFVKVYNQAALNLWGVQPTIGKTKWCGSLKIFLPDGSQLPLDRCPMAMVIKQKQTVSLAEVIMERPDGTRRNVLMHPKLLKNSSGTLVGAINILEDITVLRTAQQELLASEMLRCEEQAAFNTGISEVKLKSLQIKKEMDEMTKALSQVNHQVAFQNEERGKRAAELVIANKELVFQNSEKIKRATELTIANSELCFQNEEKGRRADELFNAKKELLFQNEEKGKRAAELFVANGELTFQNEEKGKRAAELIVTNTELAFQIKRAAELIIVNAELTFQSQEKDTRFEGLVIANGELTFQNGEKGKRAAELIIMNDELAFQNSEKGKRAVELLVANSELAFQNEEKAKRAAELVIANEQLAFQNQEKESRAGELHIANRELVFQNTEREKRAAELIIANRELAYQNIEKGKRAAELIIANGELAFQIGEKERRTAELVIANKELVFQNIEKEKRAAEFVIANIELAFQNEEKEKRAAELAIANKELVFQNEEKEKRAAELILMNEGLEAFSYVSSHDLQEPLRKIQTLSDRLLETESDKLSPKGKDYLARMQSAALRMRLLINDLLAFSRLNISEREFEEVDLSKIVDEIKWELADDLKEQGVLIDATGLCKIQVIPFQFRQIINNLINNAIKFARPGIPAHIIIRSVIGKGMDFNEPGLIAEKGYCHVSIADNGIGFNAEYKDRIFEVFQRLHQGTANYSGSGIGLAIVKKVVDNHRGVINATGVENVGATFNIYIPVSQD